MKAHHAVGRLGGSALASIAIGVGLLVMTAAPALAVSQSGSGCAPASVLAARASTEAPGEGVIASLVDRVQASVSAGVTESSVNYPATLNNYASSAAQGDTAIKSQLTALVNQCPSMKIVIVGYSQGAQLVGDVLAGGGTGSLGAATAPAPASVTSHVVAAVQFGDPRHVAGKSFNLGTATNRNGLFPRPASQTLDPFANILRSWCDTGDPFCAGGFNVNAHLVYDQKYDAAATTFVKGKLNVAGVN